MANMSYCRFENTYRDLQDCHEFLEPFLYNERECGDLSDTEAQYAAHLIHTAQEIVELVRGMVTTDLEDDQPLSQADIQAIIAKANEKAKANDENEEDE